MVNKKGMKINMPGGVANQLAAEVANVSETKEKAAGMRNTETVWAQPEAPAVTEPRSMLAAAEEEASAAEAETGQERLQPPSRKWILAAV